MSKPQTGVLVVKNLAKEEESKPLTGVLIKAVDPSKLEPRAHGPYTITQVYTNGTIDVRRNPQVIERLNIRRVIPFKMM